MNRKRLLTVLGGTKNILPISVDFSTLADGSLPSIFTGYTWSIATGKAVNTPTETATLLTDGSLEATYTDGLCGTLTKAGSPTVAESADAHAGSKAQQIAPAAFNDRLNFAAQAAVAKTFYKLTGWGKRTVDGAGSTQIRLAQVESKSRIITAAAYTRYAVVNYMTITNNVFAYAAIEGNETGDTVIVDDFAMTKLTQSTLFALLPKSKSDVTIKIDTSVADTNGAPVGIVARIDNTTTPTYFVIASIRSSGQYNFCSLDEFVAGVKTAHLADIAIPVAYRETAYFELRLSGTTASLYYDGTEVGGSPKTLDAVGQGNKIHGLFSTDAEVSINRFFVEAL